MKGVCSFCGQSEDRVLIRNLQKSSMICNECIKAFYKNLAAKGALGDTGGLVAPNADRPSAIKAGLDQYVIGQDEAKKVLSVAVYNHYKRLQNRGDMETEIQKSNILMLGPTGSGKTYLIKTLARILNVPLAIADVTSMTEAGYIGKDVESVLKDLLECANGNPKLAECGIVYLDEIDKLCSNKGSDGRAFVGHDPSHSGVQHALLKMLEGNQYHVMNGSDVYPEDSVIDTSNILFICGGAFSGLEEIVKKRLKKEAEANYSIGFNHIVGSRAEDKRSLSQVFAQAETADFEEYGVVPELYGRLPVTVCLDDLSHEELVRILHEPKNSLVKQYQALLRYDNVKLEFEKDALHEIADIAIKRKTGARGLRSILERSMNKLMYDIPDHKDIASVMVTKEFICGTAEPVFQYKKKQLASAKR